MPSLLKRVLQKYGLALGLGSLGLILGGIAVFDCVNTQSIVRDGGTATGTVIRLSYTAKGAYCPIVRFSTDKGETIEERGRFGTSPPRYKVGDKVQLYYRKDDPKRLLIDDWGELYFLTTIFGVASAILLSVSMVMLCTTAKGLPFPGTFAAQHRR